MKKKDWRRYWLIIQCAGVVLWWILGVVGPKAITGKLNLPKINCLYIQLTRDKNIRKRYIVAQLKITCVFWCSSCQLSKSGQFGKLETADCLSIHLYRNYILNPASSVAVKKFSGTPNMLCTRVWPGTWEEGKFPIPPWLVAKLYGSLDK